MKFTIAVSALSLVSSASALNPIWTFDKGSDTADHGIKLTNDPVMGGLSKSTFNVTEPTLQWEGKVEIVPSLSAPGFCNLETDKNYFDKFPDASADSHLTLLVKSSLPDYKGFKASFGGGSINPQFKSFKADFFLDADKIDAESGFMRVDIPFTDFSNNWSSYTGEPIVKCSDDESVCPTAKNLKNLQQIGLWAEGVEGEFDLEVLGIFSDTIKSENLKADYSCQVQDNLQFGVSDVTAASIGLPNADADEGLAQAICCDTNFKGYPEPKEFYASQNFFKTIDSKGVTTFYDSACGLPLYKAPIGRSYADFVKDTNEHGWPAFRGEEIISENLTVEDGIVYSTCGTKLGTVENDEIGERYCMDLVCIAGNP